MIILLQGPSNSPSTTHAGNLNISRLDGHTYITRAKESSTVSESIDCLWSPGPDVTTEFVYTWTGDDGSTSSTDTALSSDDHVNAYGVYIRWQSTDFSTPASNTATTTTAAATSSETAADGSSGSDSGLSTGAKAGVGVGVAVGVILAVTALAFIFMRRRNSRPPQYQQTPDDAGSAGWTYQPPSEMPTQYSQGLGKQVVELPAGTNNMAELDSSRK